MAQHGLQRLFFELFCSRYSDGSIAEPQGWRPWRDSWISSISSTEAGPIVDIPESIQSVKPDM
jgi:hypothetical protein